MILSSILSIAAAVIVLVKLVRKARREDLNVRDWCLCIGTAQDLLLELPELIAAASGLL